MIEKIRTIESAKVFLQYPNGNILLLRRSLSDLHRPGQWDLPGGELEEGEKPLAGAIRETSQETGLTIDEQDIEGLYTSVKQSRHGHINKRYFYYGTVALTAAEIRLSHEHIDFSLASLVDAECMLRHPIQQQALRYAVGHNFLRVADLAS